MRRMLAMLCMPVAIGRMILCVKVQSVSKVNVAWLTLSVSSSVYHLTDPSESRVLRVINKSILAK